MAKKQGKVDLSFSLAQVENEQFIENMDAEGVVGDINYKISFGVDSVCQV